METTDEVKSVVGPMRGMSRAELVACGGGGRGVGKCSPKLGMRSESESACAASFIPMVLSCRPKTPCLEEVLVD